MRRWLVAGVVLGAWLVAPSAARADAAEGKALYAKLRCSMCHRVEGSGGKKGPDLSDVGAKRDVAWLRNYLADPKSVNPKATMPPVKASHEELEHLIEYLLTLKGSH